jgi:hypothetical protein
MLWQGHGALELVLPGAAHAWVAIWSGPERRLDHWYVNFQEPLRRTAIGYDTLEQGVGATRSIAIAIDRRNASHGDADPSRLPVHHGRRPRRSGDRREVEAELVAIKRAVESGAQRAGLRRPADREL